MKVAVGDINLGSKVAVSDINNAFLIVTVEIHYKKIKFVDQQSSQNLLSIFVVLQKPNTNVMFID